MVNNDGNVHEIHTYYCPQLKGVNLISPAAIIKSNKKSYFGYDIHYNDNLNEGSITFHGWNKHNSYTLDCKVSKSGLYYMKLLPNRNSYYVHSMDSAFKDML